jgi:hypothetical protein
MATEIGIIQLYIIYVSIDDFWDVIIYNLVDTSVYQISEKFIVSRHR